MKKALSLALTLMMLMTMICSIPVTVSAALGDSADTPIMITSPAVVTNSTSTVNTLRIPAHSTKYYKYNVKTFMGDWSVSAIGLSAIIVDGVTYNETNMLGELVAPLNFTTLSSGVVAYVNDTDELVTITLQHNPPTGSMANPAEAVMGENNYTIPAEPSPYYVQFVPTFSGEYTFNIDPYESFYAWVEIDGEDYDLEDGELVIDLESYIPVTICISLQDIVPDVTLTIASDAMGSADAPIWLSEENLGETYTIPGAGELWFNMDAALAGSILHINGDHDFIVEVDGEEYVSENGSVSAELIASDWYIELFFYQDDETDCALSFSLEYPAGSSQNPIGVQLGDNEISIPAGADGYYYSYVVEKDGLLVATPADASAMSFLEMSDEKWEHTANMMDGATVAMLPVTAGETIQIFIAGVQNIIDEENYEILAVDTILNLDIADAPLYTTFESADLQGWESKSDLSVDDVEFANGWYSAKFAVTADWGNMYTYINVEPNTDYEISFKAKGALANGLWVKFHDPAWVSGDIAEAALTATTEWAEYTATLNSGDNTTVVLLIQYAGYAADGQTLWLDDILVKKSVGGDEPQQPADLINGDFEDNSGKGWNFASGEHAFVGGAHGGNYALQLTNPAMYGEAAGQTVAVLPNTSYTLGWWSKRVAGTGAFNMYLMDGADYGNISADGQNWMNETSGNWVYQEQVFNTGSSTSLLIKLSSETNNAGTILIDDITLKINKQPSDDGFIKNGDFETGKADPWTLYSGTGVSVDAAHDGEYGLHVKNPSGGWGGTAFQDFAVEVGKKYMVTMWAKALSQGQNIQIQNPAGGTSVASAWFTKTEWTKLTFEFEAVADSVRINVCGGGTKAAEEIYIDSVEVIEVKDPSFDGYITNGDFECGSATGWDVFQGTYVDKAAANDGNFGINLKGTGGWGAMLEQRLTNLVAGETYTFSLWYKANAVGSNMTLKQNGQTLVCVDGENTVSSYLDKNEWTQMVYTFVATADGEAVLNFCGAGTGEAEDLYVDDILLVKSGSSDPEDHKPGDANGDNQVNNKDLALLQRYLAKWEISINKDACDVNNDGQVNNKDLALMQRYLAKWDVELM